MRATLLGFIIALCALVVYQWVRESKLRVELTDMDVLVKTSQAAQADLEDKLRMWEGEIKDLTERTTAAAAKEKELQTEIARLVKELTTRDEELKNATATPQDFAETMKARNEEVTKQNEAILKQNAALQKLTNERDDLIEKLNARTREFNEVTAKYNQLLKSR